MTERSLEELARHLRDDERLRAELEAAADANGELSLDAFLRVAAAQGYDVTREDLDSAAAGAPAELDESELDAVAGGATEELFGNINFLQSPLGSLKLKR